MSVYACVYVSVCCMCIINVCMHVLCAGVCVLCAYMCVLFVCEVASLNVGSGVCGCWKIVCKNIL